MSSDPVLAGVASAIFILITGYGALGLLALDRIEKAIRETRK